ncbi:uncharacterized protein CDAR_50131 [Caerostris darwini]|uniref:TCTP n=1 Tax=Caerostris darwini TaxID=1538125 RepID=A0AAV4UX94_9ARAC|nr:uncharacterized protein CDAR_50131 [Caerostris darwini]
MSEETVEAPIDLDDALETGGLFFVTQILPVVAEEDLKPPTDDADVEGEEEPRPEPIEEDLCTYQLEPTVTVKPQKIVSIAQRILEEHFQDKDYATSEMRETISKISFDIQEEVKSLMLDRYRIVCHVTVGEKCEQDVAMAFLCLWKHEFDHYAVAKYDGVDFFATALVFVLYKQ